MLYNTGARVSEIIGVKVSDVVLDESHCVHLRGKGRKQRTTPLWKSTIQEIRAWLVRNPSLREDAALLPNRDGHAIDTKDNFEFERQIEFSRSNSLLDRGRKR